MSAASKPADLNDGEIRRNPGEPSAAEAAANRYNKPRFEWQGLTIAIENPAGSVRRGPGWEVRMRFDYGEILGTMGVDGDPVDVIVGPNLDAPTVYVVHQRRFNDWANYDEDKCCVGFDSQSDAEQAFLSNYTDPRFLGPITALPVAEFVAKVRATLDAPAMVKAHVDAYTRKDGVAVAAHEDSRTKHYQAMFAPSLGIKRQDMPQVPNGVKQKFLDELKAAGVSVEEATVDPKTLKPTQSDYKASNMDHLTAELRAGRYDKDTRILVSSDGRVLDGHHRWAVMAMEGHQLPILKIGMPAMQLLDVARKFNVENGVEARGIDGGPDKLAKALPLVLFLKAHVGPYLRGGKIVNIAGYQGRAARPKASDGRQLSLFAPPSVVMGPSPYKGKDPVKDTMDLFEADEHGEMPPARRATREDDADPHAHLLADLPGASWARGKGMISGHYAVKLNGEVVANYHAKPEDAAAEAKRVVADKARWAKEADQHAKDVVALRERLLAGGQVTDLDLKLVGLRPSSSGLQWFIPAAAKLFGITSHAVRPHIKDLIRVGHTDMGVKKEFVDPAKGLAAIADGLGAKPKKAYTPVTTDEHPAPMPRSLLQSIPEDRRDEWKDLHRQQHELHHYELGQVREKLVRGRTKRNKAQEALRAAEAGLASVRGAPIPDPAREAEAQKYVDKTHADYTKIVRELDGLIGTHDNLYSRAAKLGREKEKIYPGSGDMDRDFASMEKRSAPDQVEHEKVMLKRYREHYKQADAEKRSAAKARPHPTETPEFKRWFGSSVITDDWEGGGKPRVLYHGTPADFSEFKPGGHDEGRWRSGPAIWLTPHADRQPAAHNIGGHRGNFADGTNVMPLYAKIENPLYLDEFNVQEMRARWAADSPGEFPQWMSPATVEKMRAGGFDGIIQFYTDRSGADNHEVIVFDPKQVKSAIGNSGAFDPEHPDITKSEAPVVVFVKAAEPS